MIQSAVELVSEQLEQNPRTLIAVGTYLVGKERVFHGKVDVLTTLKSIEIYLLAIAKALDCKIFVEARKFRILNQLEDDDLSKRLTMKPDETNVHIVGMGSVTPPVHFHFSHKTVSYWA